MNRFLLICAFLFCTFSQLSGQNYLNESIGGLSIWGEEYLHRYQVTWSEMEANDTIIDGLSYWKLLNYGFVIDYEDDNLGTPIFPNDTNHVDTTYFAPISYYRYLREEDKRIYEYLEQKDSLILDFDLEVGDSLLFSPPFRDSTAIIEIDTFHLGHQVRKIFVSDSGFKFYEGIGVGSAMFESKTLYGVHSNGFINCYSQNGEQVRLGNFWPVALVFSDIECNPPEPYSPIVSTESSIRTSPLIYPNPFQNEFIISIPPSVEEKYTHARLFNAQGKLVHESIMDANELRITSDFPKGFYTLTLFHESGIVTKKLIAN